MKEKSRGRSAGKQALLQGQPTMLAEQDAADRAALFIAIEAHLSATEARKIEALPLRPMIDRAAVEEARAKVAERRENERLEREFLREAERQRRAEAAEARKADKIAREQKKRDELLAKHPLETAVAALPGRANNEDDQVS